MAPRKESAEIFRKLRSKRQRRHPIVRDREQMAVERFAQFRHQRRNRIGEILILAAAETEPRHVDATAEEVRLGIERAQFLAFASSQDCAHVTESLIPQARVNFRPRQTRESIADWTSFSHMFCNTWSAHALKAPATAFTTRSTSSSVVCHPETLTRIARRPRHVVPPKKASPLALIAAITWSV